MIRDAETQQPISNAMVSLTLDYACFLPLNPGGPSSNFLANVENTSVSNGNYFLPFRFYFLPPLLCGTSKDLNIVKAGYFPSRIMVPIRSSDIDLYPIKYYTDYIHYKNAAAKGELRPPYSDSNIKEFKEYQAELNKMAGMQFRNAGEDGVFLNVPGAQFSELKCTSAFTDSNIHERPETSGIEGIVCTVLDAASDKWYAFDSRGAIISLGDSGTMSKKNEWFFGENGVICNAGGTGKLRVFDSRGESSDLYPSCSPLFSDLNISVSVEDKHIVCVTAVYIGGKTFCKTFDEEVETIKTFAGEFFIKFHDGQIRKFIQVKQDGPLKETVSFYDHAVNFLKNRSINSFDIGRSTSTRTLYITDGSSRIFRVDLDGNPDRRIEVLTTQSNNP